MCAWYTWSYCSPTQLFFELSLPPIFLVPPFPTHSLPPSPHHHFLLFSFSLNPSFLNRYFVTSNSSNDSFVEDVKFFFFRAVITYHPMLVYYSTWSDCVLHVHYCGSILMKRYYIDSDTNQCGVIDLLYWQLFSSPLVVVVLADIAQVTQHTPSSGSYTAW